MMTRRKFILTGGVAVAAGIVADAYAIEPNRLEVTNHVLSDSTSSSATRIRFAQISDLHLRNVGGLHERLCREIGNNHLDFVMFTGDSVDHENHLPILDEFMDLLPAQLPKYAILGNWEHWGGISPEKLSAVFAKHNCRLLINESVVHSCGNTMILLTGLDDMLGGTPSLEYALRSSIPTPHHFLLQHCPGYLDRLPRVLQGESISRQFGDDFDLSSFTISHMFSGHTHGGQVSLLGVAPFLPQGSGSYLKGWYRNAGTSLYVSKGIGTSILPVRFGAIPEVAVFEYSIT